MNIQSNIKQEIPMNNKKVWTRSDIDELLLKNDIAVMRAIVRLFEMQTRGEQYSAQAKNINCMGFNAADAKAGTRMARWLLGMNDKNVRRYPPKDLRMPLCNVVLGAYRQNGGSVMDRARKIALKHSAQLVKIANS